MTRSLIALLALFGLPTSSFAADEGVDLGSAKEVRVVGKIFDARTKEPLPEAQAAILSDAGTTRGASGPDGSYLVTTRAASGLGIVSVVFSHSSYQEKYLETVVRDAFRGSVDVRVEGGKARIRAKKVDRALGCTGDMEIPTKGLDVAPFRMVCDGTLSGIEFEVRGTTIAVLAAGPFTLRVRSGRLEIRDSANDVIELRVGAGMLPR